MRNLLTIIGLLYGVFLLSQNNNVVVNGKTNINTFKCVNEKFNQQSNSYSFSKNQLPYLQLEVNNFDCRNRIMTNDLRKTLQAEKYPKMFVKFVSFKKVSNQQYNARIEVKRTAQIKYYDTTFYPVNNAFVGREYVRFSDFGLKAPTKMGGMVQVEDRLDLILTLNNY